MTTPTAILFDMGGTLVSERAFDIEAGRARMLALANNPRGATLADYAAVADEFHEKVWAERDEHMIEFPVSAFGRIVFERLGLTFTCTMQELEREFWQAASTMDCEPGVFDTLDQLYSRRTPMGVISNSAFSGHALSWQLDRLGLLNYFAFVMSSADYGLRKPHPAMLLTAAARLGAPTAACWYIGDIPKYDAAAAHAAGMTSVWYNPQREAAPEPPPNQIVHHWDELLTLV